MAKKSQKPTGKPAAQTTSGGSTSPTKWLVIAVLVAAAAFGAYELLGTHSTAGVASAPAAPASASVASDSAPITGPEVDGTAVVAGGVQKISVNVSTVYNPNVVFLKAGVPSEITFAGGQGCTLKVQSQALGFAEDLSAGPQTVKIGALGAGTYPFACGMNMVHGRVVVR